ncbi:hypothetical protein CYLTODRAFT_485673 [Cylindrobasidium torrendii FP15055 ss-10]|uniref:HNH nuclease domain-containing protein n=1 Tax=Cylindrobasidium torrendii FP15055 ss-10 TaxID=1314674 RepID=A0A0D7BS66_9AGAR|nr:hypothetical protein CYLTODRAFT_485673 [Cylindrobasidium torrendii FP15055 ss-10]
MTSLPSLDAVETEDLTDTLRSAYSRVLLAEERAATAVKRTPRQHTLAAGRAQQNLMHARLIGFLLLQLYQNRDILGDRSARYLAAEVLSEEDEKVVFYTGLRYREYFFCAFRAPKAGAPSSSDSDHRLCFESMNDLVLHCLKDKEQATTKRALVRDGFRCQFTGAYDRAACRQTTDLYDLARTSGKGYGTTQGCAILNLPDLDRAHSEAQRERARSETHRILTILTRLGFPDIVTTKDVSNTFTLRTELRNAFNDLTIYLEAADEPNHYILRIPETANTNAAALAERPIHFTTAYKNLPVPDARLLALHACCAQAAQLSGLSHFLTQLDRDIEATPVMSEDGTSAFLLDVLLTRVALASTQP